MTTELKQAAQQAVDAFDAFGDADDFTSLFELTQKIRALRTALQQAETQQPSSKEHLFELWWEAHMPNATQEQAWTAFTAAVASNGVGIAAQQPATGEPVQADSSEHLRVIASLGAALRRLSFAAQTTGGTDGPDAELQSAIGQAEQALSLGGIWQAMSATTEPVLFIHPDTFAMNSAQVGAWKPGYELTSYIPLYTHPAPNVPADVVRDAERYRWLRDNGVLGFSGAPSWRVSVSFDAMDAYAQTLDSNIDAAMLAAK